MVSLVNPPPQRIPTEWMNNGELRAFSESLRFTVFQLYKNFQEGSEVDLAAILARLDDIETDIVAIEIRLDALEALEFVEINAISNHTTTRNEIITCTNTSSIDITLNASPVANERVYITRRNQPVWVDAGASTVNGQARILLNQVNQSRLITYNSTVNYWSVM